MSVSINGTTGLSLGAGSITFADSSTQNTAATGFGFKNRIINGAMMIDQRNAGASVTPASGGSGTYTLDRWNCYASQASKYTVQQNAGSVTPPSGYVNYLGVTSSSAYAVSSGDIFILRQFIEGYNIADLNWGSASAQSITVSFKVYSSLTGTFGGALLNSSANRSYPFSYTVNSANTWTSISITIPGDTSGTWATNNSSGIAVIFGLGVGSAGSGTAGSWAGATYYSATGATSVVGTNGATFYITGVQLEKGSTATSFDYRPYGTELALCQRYYYKSPQQSNGEMFSVYYASGGIMGTTCFPVTLRAQPTVTYGWSTPYSGNTFADVGNGGTITLTLTQNQVTASRICNVYDNSKTGWTLGACYSTYLTASAEL